MIAAAYNDVIKILTDHQDNHMVVRGDVLFQAFESSFQVEYQHTVAAHKTSIPTLLHRMTTKFVQIITIKSLLIIDCKARK